MGYNIVRRILEHKRGDLIQKYKNFELSKVLKLLSHDSHNRTLNSNIIGLTSRDVMWWTVT